MEKIDWQEPHKFDCWLERTIFIKGGSEDRENFGWVKNSKIDFSLARNTIVLWTIQSRHLAKHLCSGWQALVRL